MTSLPLGRKIKHKRKVPCIVLAALSLALLLTASLPSQALAQGDSTTVGTLSLYPAFENMGVISSYSGDDNGNNQATLEYREVGSATWKPGIPMTVDRREELEYYGPPVGTMPNPWVNQGRAVIFGLNPDTQYEVRITYTDSDGVNGTNPVTGTATTRNDDPPSNGNTYYVSTTGSDETGDGSEENPWRTIQHAVGEVEAGDRVLVESGTYAEQVVISSISGTADNYITFESRVTHGAIIAGEKSEWQNFYLENADYIRIKGFHMLEAENCPIRAENCNYCIIEDNIIEEGYWAGSDWARGGIWWRNSHHLTVQRNHILRYRGGDYGATMGVMIEGECDPKITPLGGGHIIRDNEIEGDFRDGIAHSGGYVWGQQVNSFYYRNYIHDITNDDAMEIDGPNVNVAIYENVIYNIGNMGISFAPVSVGPCYVLRNEIVDCHDAILKLGSTSHGYLYIYHNTMHNFNPGNGPSMFGSNSEAYNQVYRNNIIDTSSCALYYRTEAGNPTNDLDYDCWQSDSLTQKFRWGNTLGPTGDGKFTNLEDFQAYTGQEPNGIFADPLFIDPDGGNFELLEGSPCRDAGVVLPGFNDENSPWPYQGSAPDIGAYELASGPPPPLGPLHHITIAPASSSLTFGQSQQFIATGYDENNRQLTGINFAWSVTNPEAGSIDSNGMFTAGNVEGTYLDVIKAEAESIAAYASVSITVPPPNEPPAAVDDAYNVYDDGVLTVAAPGVIANDSDADGDLLTAIPTSNVSHGTLSMNADGSFTYTPDAGYAGSDSFTYVANDGQADSNTATVTITVNSSPPPGQTAIFGLDSGDNTWGEDAGIIDSMKFTCLDDGTLSKVGLLVDDASPSGNVKVAVYDHDATNDLPQNLIWGGSGIPVTNGWMEWETSPVQLSKDASYWLVLWMDTQNDIRFQSGAGRHVWWLESYGDWPAALDDSPSGTNNNQYVMLATYTINAGPLDHIVVMPATVDVEAGGSQQFTATGYDQYDNEVPITPAWSTDVGSVDESGLFVAQGTAGVSGYVKATVDAIEVHATVNIVAEYIPGDADGDGSVTSLDITKVERIIMGLDDPTPGADANGDGSINTLDITKIELIIMGG